MRHGCQRGELFEGCECAAGDGTYGSMTFGKWIARDRKRSESCLASGCNKPEPCSERKPSRWCETTRTELVRPGGPTHPKPGGGTPGGNRPPLAGTSEAGRFTRTNSTTGGCREASRLITENPEGEGKVRRMRTVLTETPSTPRGGKTLESRRQRRKDMRGAAKANELLPRRNASLLAVLEGQFNATRGTEALALRNRGRNVNL